MTARGSVRARNVVAAVGEPRKPVPTQWTIPKDRLLDPWDLPEVQHQTVAVIGAGLSAAQTVVRLAKRQCNVTWIMRGEERFQCADVDARYFRPEGRASFSALSFDGRHQVLGRERRPSVMFELAPALKRLEAAGKIDVLRDQEAISVTEKKDKVEVRTAASVVRVVDSVAACLGLEPKLPRLFDRLDVATSAGYPVLNDDTLESSTEGLYFLGGLASLSLGPAAKNLDGTRVGSQRIVAALAKSRAR